MDTDWKENAARRGDLTQRKHSAVHWKADDESQGDGAEMREEDVESEVRAERWRKLEPEEVIRRNLDTWVENI